MIPLSSRLTFNTPIHAAEKIFFFWKIRDAVPLHVERMNQCHTHSLVSAEGAEIFQVRPAIHWRTNGHHFLQMPSASTTGAWARAQRRVRVALRPLKSQLHAMALCPSQRSHRSCQKRLGVSGPRVDRCSRCLSSSPWADTGFSECSRV